MRTYPGAVGRGGGWVDVDRPGLAGGRSDAVEAIRDDHTATSGGEAVRLPRSGR